MRCDPPRTGITGFYLANPAPRLQDLFRMQKFYAAKTFLHLDSIAVCPTLRKSAIENSLEEPQIPIRRFLPRMIHDMNAIVSRL
jgi:hypothetical protein